MKFSLENAFGYLITLVLGGGLLMIALSCLNSIHLY